jgi:hypothetical protein
MLVQKSSVSACFDAVMTAGSFGDPARWPLVNGPAVR